MKISKRRTGRGAPVSDARTVDPSEGNRGDAHGATGGDVSASPARASEQRWEVRYREKDGVDRICTNRDGEAWTGTREEAEREASAGNAAPEDGEAYYVAPHETEPVYSITPLGRLAYKFFVARSL